MTEAEMIARTKILIGDERATDEDISVYLSLSSDVILSRLFPFDKDLVKSEIPLKYQNKQCEIAAFLYNKRGAEGETSHSEGGISRSYENGDVPDSMLKGITPFCGVIQ